MRSRVSVAHHRGDRGPGCAAWRPSPGSKRGQCASLALQANKAEPTEPKLVNIAQRPEHLGTNTRIDGPREHHADAADQPIGVFTDARRQADKRDLMARLRLAIRSMSVELGRSGIEPSFECGPQRRRDGSEMACITWACEPDDEGWLEGRDVPCEGLARLDVRQPTARALVRLDLAFVGRSQRGEVSRSGNTHLHAVEALDRHEILLVDEYRIERPVDDTGDDG